MTIFERGTTLTAEVAPAGEQDEPTLHEPEGEATQTAETRPQEENNETDKPETALDDHTESHGNNGRKPEIPMTMGPP